jgi:hypothetical protein
VFVTREYFTKHGMHLNEAGKEGIAQRLAIVVRSFRKRERMSPISLYWKDDTSLSDPNGNESHITMCNLVTAPKLQLSTIPEESLGSEVQDPAESLDKKTEEKVKTALSQPTKRQKKKTCIKKPGFFMDNVTPVLTVSQSAKGNELVNLTTTQDPYNEIHSDMTFKSYEIWLLHNNVQSLSNKLLDIAIILATEHSNLNILCFTEHWLSEVQLKVLNIDGFRLVSSFSRRHSASGGSCIFMRRMSIIFGSWERKKFLKYL